MDRNTAAVRAENSAGTTANVRDTCNRGRRNVEKISIVFQFHRDFYLSSPVSRGPSWSLCML